MNQTTTGKNSKYARKKAAQKSGSYSGDSPFFNSNPEWAHLRPLHTYPHLNQPGMRTPKPGDRKDNRYEN